MNLKTMVVVGLLFFFPISLFAVGLAQADGSLYFSDGHSASINYTQIPCYTLTLEHSGSGTDPIPSPGNSPTCTPGSYNAEEVVQLVAVPDSGWGMSGWSGTDHDPGYTTKNHLTMPAADHVASVTYSANLCFVLTLGHSGSGADPIPEGPTGIPFDKGLVCRPGEYGGADLIDVKAVPDPRWTVDSWTGTDNDTSSSPENRITMPFSDHSATVAYTESTDGFVSKLITAHPHPGGLYGESVAISVDTVVVGAPGQYALRADVFERNQDGPDRWGLVKSLVPADPVSGGDGTRAVSISGDTIAIGEPSASLGVPGVVYVFERNHDGEANWGEIRRIQAPEPAERDGFGLSVSIDGNTLAVGAWGDAGNRGAVWIFERDKGGDNNWGMVRKVVSSEYASGNQAVFGYRLAMEGDLLVAYGAKASDPEPLGEVYFFERNKDGENNWGQVNKKTGGPTVLEGHKKLAVSGDIVAVGMQHGFANGTGSGSVSVYRRDAGGVDNWGLDRTLLGAGSQDRFGASVALSSEILVVGATDASEATPGQARVFSRDLGGVENWGALSTLSPYDGNGGDLFGYATDVDGATVVVGMPYIGEWDFGSVYIFDLQPSPPCYSLDITHTGSGSVPVASPLASPDCRTGFYREGELVTLTANPDPDWTVGSWSGSDNDSSTLAVNSVTMPAVEHMVTVNYSPPDLIFAHGFEQGDN